jgi:transcriptional regulator with XRE-family HTH domain
MTSLGNKQIFSNNLKKVMEQRKVDRTKLCEDLGMKYSTVSEWISAKKYPRIDKIEMLANYFGINKSDLIEDKTIESNAEVLPHNAIGRGRRFKSDKQLHLNHVDTSLAVMQAAFCF